jgi:glycerate kinase
MSVVKVLVAPDRYVVDPGATELAAAEAAECVARGWARSAPADELDLLPLSDGGPGFVDVLTGALPGEVGVVTVRGPLGDPVPARVLTCGETAYVEAAEAVGLHLVPPASRDPLSASSYGVGELVLAAAATGASRVVVGVGGTATVDGGRGLLEAVDGRRDELAGRTLVAATATDAPLMGSSGAAHGFAAAKGADRAARDELERRMRQWATEHDGGLAVRPGAGAGGGIGFGLLLLGAQRVNGTELVAEATRLADRVRAADLAVTALGVFDWEALRGRVVVGVTRAAQQVGRPTVVLADRVEVGRRELSAAGVDGAYAAEELALGDQPHTAGDRLAVLAARVARSWSR